MKLFNPQVHRCGLIVLKALEDQVRQKVLKPALFKKVDGALRAALGAIKKAPRRKFELGHAKDFARLAREQVDDED